MNVHPTLAPALLGNWLRLLFKPLLGQFVGIEEVVGLVPDFCVVVVDPFDLIVTEQRWLDEIAADGSHSDMFKAQPLLVTEFLRSVDFTGHNNI